MFIDGAHQERAAADEGVAKGGAKLPSTNGVAPSPMIVAPIVGTVGEEEEEDDDAIIPQITFGADGGFVLDTARFLAFDFCIPRSLKKKN